MNSDESVKEWENDSVSNDISDDSEPEDGEIAFVNISHSGCIGAMVDSSYSLYKVHFISQTLQCLCSCSVFAFWIFISFLSCSGTF